VRRITNIKLIDRMRNEKFRKMYRVKQCVLESMKVNKLKWFRHMDRFSEEREDERRRSRSECKQGIENILKNKVRNKRCKKRV
jgi:hypothetical protein